MRIRGYDEETEEFIGNIEQLEGDIADLTKTAKTPGGISLFTDETKQTYKSTYELLKDISGVYHDLTDKQQAGLLEKLAGKRGGQVLAGILDDFSEVERAMQEMQTAAGAADAEMKVVEESLDFRINRLKQTWVSTLQGLIDRGDIGKLIDLFTKLSEVIGKLIDKLGLLGTIGVGAGIFGGIKAFKNLDTILATLTKFSQIGEIISLAKNGVNTLETVSKIADAIRDMDDAQKIAVVSAMKLSKTQATQVLLTAEVKTETIEAAVAQGTLATSENVTTGSTISLSNAYKGLAASLGISTAALTAFIATAAGIAIGISAWIAYKQHIKETATAAADSAKAIQEEQSAIDGQIAKYKELKEKLKDTNLTEEEQYEVKKQLFELQKNLNETYGDEAGKLDLVNGEYETQLELLKQISQEKAQGYLQEHQSDYDAAQGRLNKISNHSFMPTQAYDYRIEDYLKSYNGLTDLNPNGGGQLAFKIVATDEEAEATLRKLYDDVEEFGKRTGIDVSTTLDDISDNIKTFTNNEVFQADKQFVKEFSKQAVLADNELRKVYSDGLDAVEAYNDALLKYDSNADEATKTQARQAIDDAKANLANVQSEFNKFKDNVTGSEGVFDSIWDGINTGAEKTLLLEERLTDKTTHAFELAEKLKGMNDFELKGIDFDSTNLSDKQQAFVDLANSLGLSKDETGELINKLVELEYVTGSTSNKINEATNAVSEWNETTKKAELDKFGIDESEFEKYLATFKELNKELSLTDEEFEQAAVAQYALDQAVEDLRSHLNDYVEVLQNCDEASIEYANSIKTLAADLSAMTGIDFSITDAQTFAQDEANLELLRQALDGDNDALTRLRANAARNIVVSVSAELGTDEFAAQYDELVSWIAANPDLGVLEAQSHLESSDFIKTCFLLIQQGKMTAEQLKQIFANLKWNISWDTTTMKVPRLSSSGGSYTGLPSNVVADMKKQGTASKYLNANYGVKYDIIDVPTNIRFERGGSATTPKVSAPTSSSGSNYRPEQKSGSGGSGGGGGSSKDPTEEAKKDEEELEDTYDEFFDYFERRLKVVSDAISLLDAHLENVVGSNAKNTLLDAQMRIYKMQQQEYADAQNMYQEMADRALAKIEDSNIVEKIKNGAVGIDEFIGKGNEEVVNAINDYTKWADKVADCKQQLAELKETIRQLELTRMKNILQDWQDVFDLRQNNAIDLIDKQISLIEESGNLVGKAFYEQQKRQTEGQLSAMEQAKRELSAELNRGLANGSIEVGTDEWIEEVGLLQEVESNILDCKQAIEEYDNAILAIHTDTFERLIDKFDDLNDELSDIAAFFDDEKVGDKFGNWSEAGQAQAGLLAQQYELAQNKVKKYAEQIDWLNGQYNAGKYSTTEYTEQLAELMDAMRESAKDAESAKEAMLDLNKARVDIVIDGINEEIEAYSDLISKEKDALSAEKDLHDYRKQIAESNKSIVAIQKQLAAIENDNSQKARAQRAKLQQQLRDAQDSLTETEYDHSITVAQEALDEQLSAYKDTRQKEIDELNAYVENSQQVLTDMFENVRANAESIGQTIVQTAQEHGFQVSTSLTESWKAGENAIASYGAVLTPATSEFIAQLENVEQQTWDLQDQADKTAVSLADMFGTRADTLVGELQRSWQAEANAQAMADALRQSMVYALESGYDISSVVSSLNSVANAAKDVAEAANDAAGALDNAISKQNAFNNMPKSSGNENVTITTLYNAPNTQATRNNATGKITQQSASDLAKKYKKKYARGLSKAEQDELAWTQELGSEFIVSPTRNSILTPIKAGDAVIDAKGTRNLFELAKIDPNDILQGSGAKVVAPQIESTNNSVSIGNLVNVEGSISSENLDAVKATIQSELKKTFRNINSGLRR